MNPDNPCHYCAKRKSDCHAICEEYTQWKDKLKELKKQIRKSKDKEMISNHYQMDKSRKLSKFDR